MRDDVIEQVRAAADITEICGEHMSLKRVGKTYRGPCPLHGGEGPNFSIDPSRGIFKCFVCGEGGDVFGFAMKLLGLDFPSAVRYVAERAGVPIPEENADREDPHAPVREAVAFAAEWFAGRLADPRQGEAGRGYLDSRGVDAKTATAFGLGLAPDAWRSLRDAARERGMEDEVLLEAGLLATSEKAEEPYDRFRNRLVFPIQDLRDRPIGFGGRDLSGRDDAPKYINSPDSPIFTKGSTLYLLNRARHAIRRRETALVVEGYMDALSLHAHGLDHAVAPLGTALTREQAGLIVRYARKVYLLYDSDRAGLRATFRTADALLSAGAEPMVVTLPEGEDPDSLVRKEGVSRLQACLADAVDVLERKLQILERHGYLETIEGRRRAVDALLPTLRSVADGALRDLYLSRAAERTGVRRETLVHELARSGPSRASGPGRPRRTAGRGEKDGREPAAPEGVRAAERNLLLLFIRDPSYLERAREAGLTPGHFRDGRMAPVARELMGSSDGDDEAASGTLRALEADATELTHPEDIFEHSLRRLLYRERLERLGEIDRELELAESEQGRELLREKEALARELREARALPWSPARRGSG